MDMPINRYIIKHSLYNFTIFFEWSYAAFPGFFEASAGIPSRYAIFIFVPTLFFAILFCIFRRLFYFISQFWIMWNHGCILTVFHWRYLFSICSTFSNLFGFGTFYYIFIRIIIISIPYSNQLVAFGCIY